MKLLTVLGTRPEIIRLSCLVPKLDAACRHVLVHTGQNFDPSLSDNFFRELSVRPPDVHLGIRSNSFAEQVAHLFAAFDPVLAEQQPDRLLLLGDTNSALTAILAKRRGIPVFHMEAGNRCYDDRVPEEVNRRLIDHSSDVLMPYTERSRSNLLREGISGTRVFVTGNPIHEVIAGHSPAIRDSRALERLGLEARRYFLVTLHRAENVDVPARLRVFCEAFSHLAERYGLPVIVSTHPRTRSRLAEAGLMPSSGLVRFLEPFGFSDFVRLEQQARCVLTDSGTVQEECAILGVATVTLRDVTERPETVECGSNILSGADPGAIERGVAIALSAGTQWEPPAEYVRPAVSDAVLKIVTGYHEGL